jgi:hypothetical protein
VSKIARVKFIRDKEPNIKALTAENKVLDGALYVATDTGTLWMGISSSSLIQIKDNINTNTTYNLTKSGNTITLRGSDGSTFNVTDSNTVYGNATASAAGLMSAADKAKLDGVVAGSNHVTVDAELSTTSTNPVQNKVIKSALDGKSNTGHTHDDRYYTESEINTKLNAKANSSHTHTKAQITDFPTSMPASDVYAWAKAASKPSYTIGEVSGNLAASRISGTISAANLPSYVDDVLEYASLSKFPTTGESGKIYTALDTNKIYRWSGSAYVVISETVALGTTHSSAGYGDESRAAYNHSTKTSGNPHHVTKTDVGLGNVDNTADSAKSVKYATSAGSAGSVAWANVSERPSSMPASDVYSWAKQPHKPSYTASEVGAAPASHSHSYLPLSGGTMSGRILRGAGGSWISARNNAIAFGTNAYSNSYNPVVGQKTAKGSWTIGNLGSDERLIFSYDTDANFNAGTNSSNKTYLPVGGNLQEIITSATIGSQSVRHANTAGSVAWGNVTGRPSSMPASDVYSWAKAASKPSYTIGEVSGNLAASRISGTISAANLPSYVDDVLEYASLSKFPTTGESGKIYTALDTNKIYRWSGSAYVVISETVALGTTHSSAGYGDESRAAYNHSTKTSGNPHHVTKTDVGLGNVDNTADSAKSVKYATSAGSAGSVAWANVSERPSSMPASDVYSWAKQPHKPSYTASEVGAAPASHSHSYLPLSGGTMSGRILRGAGGSWISARNNAIAFGTNAYSNSYNPVVGQKTAKGSWTIGNLGSDERLIFSYDTDANFNAGTNSSNKTYLPVGGNSQEIITSATIGSQSVSHANTAGSVAWGNVTGRPTIPSVGNGTVTITQNGTNKGSFTLNQSGNATIALTDTNTNTWRPEEVIVSSSQPNASTCKLWIKI